MTNGGERVFVDTNILIYAYVAESPLNQNALDMLKQLWESGSELWISRQVMREYLVTVTHPQNFTNPPPIATVLSDINAIVELFRIAEDNSQVTERLLELIKTYNITGRQIHDTNIVATMLAHQIAQLVTHNATDFNRYGSLIHVTPLETLGGETNNG